MIRVLTGDSRIRLRELDAESVHCCVTSPPYYGLRDYGVSGQLGLEATPEAYVVEMVSVFREIRRVLREDGTLWLNVGDSYASRPSAGLKPKDLIGIPWMLAFALRADGWHLRQDIIWAKPNPMPEPVADRCTRAHEYLFMFSKSGHYRYDAKAIEEPGVDPERQRNDRIGGANGHRVRHSPGAMIGATSVRNRRSVWSIPIAPYPGAHFATFPPDLVEPCILAGSLAGGTVLDPFLGAGTTALVADRLGRNCIGIEINPEYAEMARRRIADDAGMFAEVR